MSSLDYLQLQQQQSPINEFNTQVEENARYLASPYLKAIAPLTNSNHEDIIRQSGQQLDLFRADYLDPYIKHLALDQLLSEFGCYASELGSYLNSLGYSKLTSLPFIFDSQTRWGIRDAALKIALPGMVARVQKGERKKLFFEGSLPLFQNLKNGINDVEIKDNPLFGQMKFTFANGTQQNIIKADPMVPTGESIDLNQILQSEFRIDTTQIDYSNPRNSLQDIILKVNAATEI